MPSWVWGCFDCNQIVPLHYKSDQQYAINIFMTYYKCLGVWHKICVDVSWHSNFITANLFSGLSNVFLLTTNKLDTKPVINHYFYPCRPKFPISLKFALMDPINNKPSLVEIMAWWQIGSIGNRHYLIIDGMVYWCICMLHSVLTSLLDSIKLSYLSQSFLWYYNRR